VSPEKRLVWNLALLVFVALPCWIALMLLASWFVPPEWMREDGFRWTLSELAGALLFWWLIMVIRVIVGGALHQLIIVWLPQEWSARRVRTAAISATAIIPLSLGLVSPNPSAIGSPRVLLPALLAMLLYGSLVRTAAEQSAAADTGQQM